MALTLQAGQAGQVNFTAMSQTARAPLAPSNNAYQAVRAGYLSRDSRRTSPKAGAVGPHPVSGLSLRPKAKGQSWRRYSTPPSEVDLLSTIGGGGNGGNTGGGGGNNGDGSNGNSFDLAVSTSLNPHCYGCMRGNCVVVVVGGAGGVDALLLLAGRTLESLPADLAKGCSGGQVPLSYLETYLNMDKNFFLRFLLRFAGARERLLEDPAFLLKMGIELGIGLVMKLTAEFTKRGENAKNELDFVFANVVMALIADYMLTWLPAPRVNFGGRAPQKQNALQKFFANAPGNAFQCVPPGQQPYTVPQRCAAIGRNGTQLLGVGFVSSLIGVGITNALLALRQALDPSFTRPNPPQGVFITSAAYATYMASSSNLRYQILAGILEQRGIEKLFAGNPSVCGALSFALRSGNTLLGSLMWVDYLRLLGLQKKAEPATA